MRYSGSIQGDIQEIQRKILQVWKTVPVGIYMGETAPTY